MEKKYKRALIYTAVSVIFVLMAVFRPEALSALGRYVGRLLLPVIIGLLTAFVLNVPINGFEKLFDKIFAKAKKKPGRGVLHIVSLILTLVCVIAVVAIFGTLVIPELVRTVKSIASSVQDNIPGWLEWLDARGINTASAREWLNTVDIKQLIDKASTGAGVVIGSIAGAAQSTVSGAVSFFMGLVIALYVQIDRDKLARQTKKLLYAYVREDRAGKLHRTALLIKNSYSKFFSGQCIEAVILGFLIFIAFLIFRIPYAGLVGFVTAICALIPYIGAFVSCLLAVLLSLLESPEKALICLAVYLAVQFIESQIIYPHVVGGTVGLSPLMTLVAVLVGGKLFGLAGMIFFIPLTAVICELLGENTNSRLKEKRINIDSQI